MTATDQTGAYRSYLASEAGFNVVRDLELANLVVPVVGNFGGPKAIRAVGAYLRAHDATVGAFYLPNVEQYLAQDGKMNAFSKSVASLPLDATSTFVRSQSGRAGARVGVGFISSLGSISAETRPWQPQRCVTAAPRRGCHGFETRRNGAVPCPGRSRADLTRSCGLPLAASAGVMPTPETAPERVLLVEHEARLRESICAHLALDRYRCDTVADGEAALKQAKETPFDLIVVDLQAPNVAGSQFSRALRHQPMNRRAPIVIIASRNAEQAALTELEDGADDFLVKPFGPGELAARARAAIRRARAARARAAVATDLSFSPPPVTYGDICIDPTRRHVNVGERTARLTEQEFRLLYLLVTNPGVVFSREGLLAEIWGTNRFVTMRSVDTLVSRLRRRIEPPAADSDAASRYLRTVRGVGYKLVEVERASR